MFKSFILILCIFLFNFLDLVLGLLIIKILIGFFSDK